MIKVEIAGRPEEKESTGGGSSSADLLYVGGAGPAERGEKEGTK